MILSTFRFATVKTKINEQRRISNIICQESVVVFSCSLFGFLSSFIQKSKFNQSNGMRWGIKTDFSWFYWILVLFDAINRCFNGKNSLKMEPNNNNLIRSTMRNKCRDLIREFFYFFVRHNFLRAVSSNKQIIFFSSLCPIVIERWTLCAWSNCPLESVVESCC